MRKDLIKVQPIYSSFFSNDEDIKKIIKLLFVESKPYSDILKSLLIINKPDCLDYASNEDYQKLIDSKSLGQLIDEGYIRLNPKIGRKVFEDIKSYIIINFDDFSPSGNPQYKDGIISFDVVCYMDEWCLDDYKIRPLTICGYIDGILNSLSDKNKYMFKNSGNNIKLSGLSNYSFLDCQLHVLNEDVSMYTLSYRMTHFTEDLEELGQVETT